MQVLVPAEGEEEWQNLASLLSRYDRVSFFELYTGASILGLTHLGVSNFQPLSELDYTFLRSTNHTKTHWGMNEMFDFICKRSTRVYMVFLGHKLTKQRADCFVNYYLNNHRSIFHDHVFFERRSINVSAFASRFEYALLHVNDDFNDSFAGWIKQYDVDNLTTRLKFEKNLSRNVSDIIIFIDDEYYWKESDEMITFDQLVIRVD